MSERTATPNTNGADPALAERRASVRHLCNLETFYQQGEGRLDLVWWPALVHNISTNGIGLVLSRCYEPGTPLAIALHSPSQNFSCSLEARVIHVNPQPDGKWVVGCVFITRLTDAELQALLV